MTQILEQPRLLLQRETATCDQVLAKRAELVSLEAEAAEAVANGQPIELIAARLNTLRSEIQILTTAIRGIRSRRRLAIEAAKAELASEKRKQAQVLREESARLSSKCGKPLLVLSELLGVSFGAEVLARPGAKHLALLDRAGKLDAEASTLDAVDARIPVYTASGETRDELLGVIENDPLKIGPSRLTVVAWLEQVDARLHRDYPNLTAEPRRYYLKCEGDEIDTTQSSLNVAQLQQIPSIHVAGRMTEYYAQIYVRADADQKEAA